MHLHRLALRAALAVSILAPALAEAHITIASGPALANKSQKISFAINHGCSGLDTLKIKIDIPATGIDGTSVRPLPSDFGVPTVTKTGTSVTAVEWAKNPADLQASDVAYYELTIKAKVSDVPFTKAPFVITQTCRPQGGTAADDVVVVWAIGNATEPAPELVIVPSHVTGWHKFTLTTAVTNATMGTFFGDAQIVWKGTSAFSSNSLTAMLITMTAGVTPLTADLAVGDEIWVKY